MKLALIAMALAASFCGTQGAQAQSCSGTPEQVVSCLNAEVAKLREELDAIKNSVITAGAVVRIKNLPSGGCLARIGDRLFVHAFCNKEGADLTRWTFERAN
jgi:hypothetical protein